MSDFHFEILPKAQKELWLKLKEIPNDFVLYGGTAIALRLGHRKSVDFDFFSNKPFSQGDLYQNIPFLKNSKAMQNEPNTLTALVHERNGNVKVSFFGNLGLKQIKEPEIMENRVKLASMLDLLGMKCATVPQRVEWKDYIDIHKIVSNTELTLDDGLAAASTIYGKQYSPIFTLKALSYFDNEELKELSEEVKKDLLKMVKETSGKKVLFAGNQIGFDSATKRKGYGFSR